MNPSELDQLVQDFGADHGRAPSVIVIHPDDWDDVLGWFRHGSAAMPASASGLTIGGVSVRRSRDVERGRPELY